MHDNIVIRQMRAGEEKEIVKVGRRAFQFFEGLFVVNPKKAMVAEINNKIVGGIIYKYTDKAAKKVAYIDEAFVDPDYHGQGVGRRLYTETFSFLWEQGCDAITALVKDDNVGSWKLFIDNDFKRVTFLQAIKELGFTGLLKQFVKTPTLFGTGMDFYLATKERKGVEKGSGFGQIVSFLLANLIFLTPAWVNLIHKGSGSFKPYFAAYITILLIFAGVRCAGGFFNQDRGKLRFNNCGSLITFLFSFGLGFFPLNFNWYPDKYQNTPGFKRRLAIPELVKWCIFMVLPLLAITDSAYFKAMAAISCNYLVLMIIPIYPFEALGAGRIYRYNKYIWLFTAVVTLVFTFFIY